MAHARHESALRQIGGFCTVFCALQLGVRLPVRIDFGQRTFSTQLKVSSDPVGSYNLQFSGKLDPRTGVFLDRSQANAGDTLAGALTYNGLQAGYFFRYTLKPTDPGYDKTLPADRNAAGGAASGGSFSGATLWGR